MSVHRKFSPGTEPTPKGQSDWAGSNPSPPSSWSTLSEGTVPFLEDRERQEAEKREARWRVVTGGQRLSKRGTVGVNEVPRNS